VSCAHRRSNASRKHARPDSKLIHIADRRPREIICRLSRTDNSYRHTAAEPRIGWWTTLMNAVSRATCGTVRHDYLVHIETVTMHFERTLISPLAWRFSVSYKMAHGSRGQSDRTAGGHRSLKALWNLASSSPIYAPYLVAEIIVFRRDGEMREAVPTFWDGGINNRSPHSTRAVLTHAHTHTHTHIHYRRHNLVQYANTERHRGDIFDIPLASGLCLSDVKRRQKTSFVSIIIIFTVYVVDDNS